MGLRGSECLSGASQLWVVGEAVGIQIGCTFTLWESPGGRSRCGSPLIMPASPPASAPTGCALGSAPRGPRLPPRVSTLPSSTSNASQASPYVIADLVLGGESVQGRSR